MSHSQHENNEHQQNECSQDVEFEFFGYKKNIEPEVFFGDNERELPDCIVSTVTTKTLSNFSKLLKKKLKPNNVVVTKNSCERMEVFGPFDGIEPAFDFSKEKWGASLFFMTKPV